MDELKAALERVLGGRDDVRVAVLFGSRARGTASDSSDVDIAYLGTADPLTLGADLSLGCGHEVDVVPLDTDDIPLLASIVRDAVVVIENRRGAYATWRSHAIASLELDMPAWQRMRDAWLGQLASGLPRGLPSGNEGR